MEKNDLATLKAENDRLMTDLEKLRLRLREDVARILGGVRLDLNLEKGQHLVHILMVAWWQEETRKAQRIRFTR